MKPIHRLCSAVLCLVSSCTVVPSGVVQPGQPGNIVQVGGKLKLTTAHGSIEADNRASYAKTMDLGIDISRGWFIFKSLDRFFDSRDAADATAAGVRKKKIDAATTGERIASDERLASQAMEIDAETLATTPAP